MSDPIVKIEHARKIGMCSRGVRQWFEVNGLDYPKFLRDGLPASELEATGNALATKVAAVAREQENQE